MKTIIFLVSLFVSAPVSAWGPYGPGWGYGMGWGGYPYGAYGAMGYGWGIQAPSFNYNTTIVQSPPIIVNNNDQQRVIVEEKEVCNQECERLRGYFGKR